ncbi:hypothetical protein [Paenibacillus solani]|uniref:hypothetical protein n=1 Tax=Paenibacillus solani TaxID=1705565 RepID=UPI003D2C5CA9
MNETIKLNDFQLISNGDCINSCLHSVFDYFGYRCDDFALFLQSNPFSAYNQNDEPDEIFIDLLNQFKMINTWHEKKPAYEFFLTSIKGNYPIIVFLDTSCLFYDSVYQKNTGRRHCIIVHGVIPETQELLISDTHIRTDNSEICKFTGYIKFTDIKNCIYVSTALSPGNNIDDIIFDQNLVIKALKNSFNNGFFTSLRAFYEELNLIGELSCEEFEKKCVDYYYHISVARYIQFNYYLKDYYATTQLNLEITLLDQIIDSWEIIKHLLIKISIRKNKMQIIKVVEKINQSIDLSENFYYRIIEKNK